MTHTARSAVCDAILGTPVVLDTALGEFTIRRPTVADMLRQQELFGELDQAGVAAELCRAHVLAHPCGADEIDWTKAHGGIVLAISELIIDLYREARNPQKPPGS